MRKLVEYPLEGGGVVVVEVDESLHAADGGDVTRGLRTGELVTHAGATFEAAVGGVQPAAVALLDRFRSLVDPPDEVQIEFGLQLRAEVGAFIAQSSGEANFKVTLHWKRAG